MEDSLKGLIITTTLVIIFMAGIFGFITGFPTDQGMIFSEKDAETYLVIDGIDLEGSSDVGGVGSNTSDLAILENQTDAGFGAWDIEVGFMGSNTQKGVESGTQGYALNTFEKLKLVSGELFDANNPISWVLGVLTTLLGLYVTYIFIKYIRTGN